MSVQEIRKSDRGGAFVHANGIDIHYLEVGQGEPLVLLHGGVVSTSSLWRNHPRLHADHMGARGALSHRSRHSRCRPHAAWGGHSSFAVLVEDVRA
jgi:pimeloyl-ACP methyl ester carboxylesterase